MSKLKPFEKTLTLNINRFDGFFYGYICSLKRLFYNISIIRCIESFCLRYGVEKSNIETLKKNYNILNNKFLIMQTIKIGNSKLESILMRFAQDALLVGWVEGQKSAFPSCSIDNAIESFMNEYKLGEDDYPLETARMVYYRITEKQ